MRGDRGDEIFLRGEVVIERRAVDPHAIGHVARAEALEALGSEERERGPDDLAPAISGRQSNALRLHYAVFSTNRIPHPHACSGRTRKPSRCASNGTPGSTERTLGRIEARFEDEPGEHRQHRRSVPRNPLAEPRSRRDDEPSAREIDHAVAADGAARSTCVALVLVRERGGDPPSRRARRRSSRAVRNARCTAAGGRRSGVRCCTIWTRPSGFAPGANDIAAARINFGPSAVSIMRWNGRILRHGARPLR